MFKPIEEVRTVNAKRLTAPIEKVRELQEKLGYAAKASKKRRFHALYDKVYRWDVLQEAWKLVRAKKGAAGIDQQTLADIEKMGVSNFLRQCRLALMENNYRPQPVRRQYIPKKDGRLRPLGIPTVRDRVIQKAVKLVIEPIFEADFKACSFGFRPKMNAKQALERVRTACNQSGNWVCDVDIQAYFDNINQDKLMKLVELRISDRRILKLIRKWLQAGVMEEGKLKRADTGTPQGGVISPLLANIYLNILDRLWEKYGAQHGQLTRYADDFVIVCKTRNHAEKAMDLIGAVMRKLDLTIHPDKTKMVEFYGGKEGFDFLGMHHRKTKAETAKCKVYRTTQQWLTIKAEKHIREKVRDRLARPSARMESLQEHVNFLNPKIRGWRNYYRTPYSYRHMAKLDLYIRERFCQWFAKKTKRNFKSVWQRVSKMLEQQRLLKLA